MGAPTVVVIAIRAAQIIFAAVVVGLAGTLIKDQMGGTTVPATINYAAFTGALGMIGGFVGIASIWVEMLQGVIMCGVDALIALFYLAGGVVWAVKLKGISCGSTHPANLYKLEHNALLTAGCVTQNGEEFCNYVVETALDKLQGRCKMGRADSAFQFMSFILLVGAIVMSVLALKNKSLSMRSKV